MLPITKRLVVVIAIFLGLAVVLLALARPSRPVAAPTTLPSVAVTCYPLYDLVRAVGADVVQVDLLLPPGANPHTFEPSPSTTEAARRAETVYHIGYGFDSWADGLGTDKLTRLDGGLALRPSSEDANSADPHYWLDVSNMLTMTTNLADDLTERFPAAAARIRQNATGYRAKLVDADHQIRLILAPDQGRQLVTLHDAWYYFAASYGLVIAGTYEPTAGREPTPKYLEALTAAVKRAGTKTLFAEPGLSAPSLQSFIQDLGLKIVTLDPGEGAGRLTYPQLMVQNAQTIHDNR